MQTSRDELQLLSLRIASKLSKPSFRCILHDAGITTAFSLHLLLSIEAYTSVGESFEVYPGRYSPHSEVAEAEWGLHRQC
jgi:hypothetical protein